MIQSAFVLLLLLLVRSSSSSSFVDSGLDGLDDGDSFQCLPDVAHGQAFHVGDFSTIQIGASCPKNNEKYLVPQTVNWHVYVMLGGNDDDEPMYSVFPPGLMAPSISNDGSTLKFEYQDILQKTYSKDDMMKAAVNFYIPARHMKKINIVSVDHSIEVVVGNFNNSTSSLTKEATNLTIQESGVENRIFVRSPSSAVTYRGSGINSFAVLNVGSGSYFSLDGVDQTFHIKPAEGVDDLVVESSGVNQKILVDGDYSRIIMSGVDATFEVNSEIGCDHATKKGGIRNDCSTSDVSVTIPESNCLASTRVIKNHCTYYAAATVTSTAGIGIALALVLVLIGSIALCYVCCNRRHRKNASMVIVIPNHGASQFTTTGTVVSSGASIISKPVPNHRASYAATTSSAASSAASITSQQEPTVSTPKTTREPTPQPVAAEVLEVHNGTEPESNDTATVKLTKEPPLDVV